MIDGWEIGTSVGAGALAGVGNHHIAKKDAERAAAASAPLGIAAQYGTWYNYGVPIAGILLSAFGVLKGAWATRILSIGGTLAGIKVPEQIEASKPATFTRWTRDSEASRRATEEARRRAGIGTGGGGGGSVIAEI